MRRLDLAGGTMIAVLLAGGGCDPHAGAPPVSGSMEEATIKGTVRLFDQPAKGGRLIFDVSNIRRKYQPPRETEIKKDGTYEIKTLVGENTVQVDGAEMALTKYRNLRDQTVTVKVPSGESTIDIDLPEKLKAPAK